MSQQWTQSCETATDSKTYLIRQSKITTKYNIKSLLTKLAIGLTIVFGFITIGTSQASATTYDLSARHTYSDLYASILFSNGQADTLNSADISYDELTKYDPDGTYGALPYVSKKSSEGVQLASLLKTYYKYNWLITRAKDADASSGLFGWISNLASRGQNALVSGLYSASLGGASLGAKLFDMGTGLIQNLQKGFAKLDPPAVFGLRSSSSSNASLLNSLLANLADALDINVSTSASNTFRMAQRMMFIIYVFITAYIMLFSFLRANAKKGMNAFFKLWIHVAVMGFTLSGSKWIQQWIDTVAATITVNESTPTTFTEDYIVDTQAWAVYLNLNLGYATSSGVSVPTDSVQAISQLSASTANISQLNEKINEFRSKYDPDGKAVENESMTDLVDGLISHSTFNVNAYVSGVSNAKWGIAAGRGPEGENTDGDATSSGDTIKAGSNYNESKYNTDDNIENTYFLIDQIDKKNLDEDTTNDLKSAIEQANGSGESSSDSEDDKSDKYRYVNVHGKQVAYSEKTPYRLLRVTWRNLKAYIFGANTANSDTTANFHNYINGTGTSQNNNPTTMDDTWDSDDKLGEVEGFKQAMYTNSLGVAIKNRYQGATTSVNGIKTFSNQTVAFILQTNLTSSGIQYQGYNTANSEQDKGKATSNNGATLVRYVVPHDSVADLAAKLGALSIVFILSGITTVIALLSLLRAPIFSASIKMITNFLVAFIKGDIAALMLYLSYYASIQLSFAFARVASFFGTTIATHFMTMIPGFKSAVAISNTTSTATTNGIISSVSSLVTNGSGTVGSWVPSTMTIVLTLVLSYVLCWPIIQLNLGFRRGHGKPLKVSLIAAITLIPYLFAEAAEEYAETFYYRLYGKSRRNSFMAKLERQVTPMSASEILSKPINDAKKYGGLALKGGAALLTGGASAGVMAGIESAGGLGAVAKTAAGKVASSFMGGTDDEEDGFIDATGMDPTSGMFQGSLDEYSNGTNEGINSAMFDNPEQFNRDGDMTMNGDEVTEHVDESQALIDQATVDTDKVVDAIKQLDAQDDVTIDGDMHDNEIAAPTLDNPEINMPNPDVPNAEFDGDLGNINQAEVDLQNVDRMDAPTVDVPKAEFDGDLGELKQDGANLQNIGKMETQSIDVPKAEIDGEIKQSDVSVNNVNNLDGKDIKPPSVNLDSSDVNKPQNANVEIKDLPRMRVSNDGSALDVNVKGGNNVGPVELKPNQKLATDGDSKNMTVKMQGTGGVQDVNVKNNGGNTGNNGGNTNQKPVSDIQQQRTNQVTAILKNAELKDSGYKQLVTQTKQTEIQYRNEESKLRGIEQAINKYNSNLGANQKPIDINTNASYQKQKHIVDEAKLVRDGAANRQRERATQIVREQTKTIVKENRPSATQRMINDLDATLASGIRNRRAVQDGAKPIELTKLDKFGLNASKHYIKGNADLAKEIGAAVKQGAKDKLKSLDPTSSQSSSGGTGGQQYPDDMSHYGNAIQEDIRDSLDEIARNSRRNGGNL